MARFKITDHQTGKTIVVSGDSAPTEDEAEQLFSDAGYRESAQKKTSTIGDVVNAIPGGLAKGVNAIVGFPGDLQEMAGHAAFEGLNFLTGEHRNWEEERKKIPQYSPTTQQINDFVSSPFGGFYKPKTVPGQYAETIASFAPAAIAPGSLAQRGARVVVPAVSSETAGQLTKGTPYEPYARVAGAVLGGLGQGFVEDRISKASTIADAPTAADLGKQASGAYKAADDAGVQIKGYAYDNLVDDIKTQVKDAGFQRKLHPKVDGVLDELSEQSGPISLGELERMRRVAKMASGSTDRDERRIARIILNKIDDFAENLDPMEVASGDPAAAQKLSEARGLWSKMRKSQTIDETIERAQNTAEAQRGNLAAGLRNEFKRLANNKQRMLGFTPDEQDAIRDVARAGMTKRAMIALGALRPRGLAALAEGGQAAHAFLTTGDWRSAVPAAAVAGGGLAAQSALNAVTRGDAQLVSAMMRSGEVPTAAMVGSNPSKAALISALLANPAR